MKIISYYYYRKTLNFHKNKTVVLLLAMGCPVIGKKYVAGEIRFALVPIRPQSLMPSCNAQMQHST